MQGARKIPSARTPEALERADVRRCGTLWMLHLDRGQRGVTPPVATRLRLATASDADSLRQAMVLAGADNPDLAATRLRGGRLGYLAEEDTPDGLTLSYAWAARPGDRVNDLGFPLSMPKTDAWIYDCATVPAARGRGLYPALVRALCDELAQRGLERAWIGTAPRNWASQRGIARAGFMKVADADWRGVQAVIYGAPGVPRPLIEMIAETTGDDGALILPDAGIPWIEAIRWARPSDAQSAGLRAFRVAYGDQIHWTERDGANADLPIPRVLLRVGGHQRSIEGDQPYSAYVQALDALAPGLPLLGA